MANIKFWRRRKDVDGQLKKGCGWMDRERMWTDGGGCGQMEKDGDGQTPAKSSR